MEMKTKKRTLDSFFVPTKKPRSGEDESDDYERNPKSAAFDNELISLRVSEHSTYPFPISHLPDSVSSSLSSLPSIPGRVINNQADLDLVHYRPYIPRNLARELFEFLRGCLPFYRVEYKIKRSGVETLVKTPRYTTVFGLDNTSRFSGTGKVIDAKTTTEIQSDKHYQKYPPRPIPKCLDDLRLSTEAATGCKFNFCLVNYYASGADSIAYHSDDEYFLGELPSVASFSLGATRDFLMKHKSQGNEGSKLILPDTKLVKLPIGSGDMILMRGRTQSNWLHSVPKRSGKNAEDGGRINVTFRQVVMKSGTENYYHYNVGTGPVFRWDEMSKEMKF